jgi:hypothetical protein
MATFYFKPQPCSSSRICHIAPAPAAAASQPLRRCPSISWRWQQPQRRHTTLQCHQRAESTSQTNFFTEQDEDDNRLRQNSGIFHPSIWADFFLGSSNPASASSQQEVY